MLLPNGIVKGRRRPEKPSLRLGVADDAALIQQATTKSHVHLLRSATS